MRTGFASPGPWLAALAALPLSGGAASAQPVTEAQAEDPLQAKAMKLAQTVQGRALVVDTAMAGLERDFIPALRNDPSVGQMEAEHPGILRAIWDGASPILREMLDARLPDLWQRLAAVYARNLSVDEIDALTRFFQSPVGRKLLVASNSKIDYKPILEESVRNPHDAIAEGDFSKAQRQAGVAAVAAMTAGEQAELVRFMSTPAGKALAAVGPEVTRTAMEWMNRDDPAAQERVNAAMTQSAEAFIAAETGKAAKKGR